MDDDALLAGVLRRLLAGPGALWSMTYRDLTINGTIDDMTDFERAAVGRATGKPTVADPLLRGKPNPTPYDLAAIAVRRAANLAEYPPAPLP